MPKPLPLRSPCEPAIGSVFRFLVSFLFLSVHFFDQAHGEDWIVHQRHRSRLSYSILATIFLTPREESRFTTKKRFCHLYDMDRIPRSLVRSYTPMVSAESLFYRRAPGFSSCLHQNRFFCREQSPKITRRPFFYSLRTGSTVSYLLERYPYLSFWLFYTYLWTSHASRRAIETAIRTLWTPARCL